jgi:ADYC domain-containing protein
MIKQSMMTLVLLCGACAVVGDEQTGEVTQNGMSFNGISFNGISFNGISFNGVSFNGQSLNGISFNGTSVAGVAIKASSSNTTPPLTGANLVGSKWSGTASDGAAVALRIDSATAGSSPNPDLWFYGISYQTSTGWSPLCGTDSTGKAIQAVSTAGVWVATAADATHYTASTTQFTLACRGATVGKCIELGYKTYKGYTNQLQSCVRLLRGDYCGTGSAWTVNGTLLNLFDNVGVQADTQAWTPEAEWTPTGALCINSQNAARYELVLSKDPKCVKRVETANCGTTFANGAILIDELSPDATASILTAQSN